MMTYLPKCLFFTHRERVIMNIEAIIAALKQAVATYNILSMKNKPGKKGKARLADFHKILDRIETRMVEPIDAILWVYDFCEKHGSLPPLVYCLLSELSRLLNIPLLAEEVLQQEIKRFSNIPTEMLQIETVAAFNVIREQKAKLDSLIYECKEGLDTLIMQDLMTFKLKTIH